MQTRDKRQDQKHQGTMGKNTMTQHTPDTLNNFAEQLMREKYIHDGYGTLRSHAAAWKKQLRDEYNRGLAAGMVGIGEEPLETLEQALDWYSEKARAMKRYMIDAKPPETNAMTAVCTELALDAGSRAALAAKGRT